MPRNGSLRIEVRNDGPAFFREGGTQAGRGLGLSNTRARLTRMYGTGYLLEVLPDEPGGTIAVLEVPWRSNRQGDS